MAGPLPGDRASRYRPIGADPPLTVPLLQMRSTDGDGRKASGPTLLMIL